MQRHSDLIVIFADALTYINNTIFTRKTLAMLLALMPAMSFAQDLVEVNGINYLIDRDKKEAYLAQKYIMEGGQTISTYEGDIVIPSSITVDEKTYSVTGLGTGTFAESKNLTSVVLPNTITYIGEGVFYGCSSLKSVKIPSTVTGIGPRAFFYCLDLTSIDLPSSITSIGAYAFQDCMYLTSIKIPNGVTTIEEGTFDMCNSLTSVEIPSTVTSIGESAFTWNNSLTTIEIPSSVTSIGASAFFRCDNLEKIVLQSSGTTFGSNAFALCPALTDFYYYATEPSSDYASIGMFGDSNIKNAVLHVPADAIREYQSTLPWSDFRSIVALEDDELPQCDSPLFTYEGNDLVFTCSTKGAQIHYSIESDSYFGNTTSSGYGPTLSKIVITAYATAEGYRPSQTVKYEVPVTVGIRGDVNQDGEVNVTDAVEVANIILKKK